MKFAAVSKTLSFVAIAALCAVGCSSTPSTGGAPDAASSSVDAPTASIDAPVSHIDATVARADATPIHFDATPIQIDAAPPVDAIVSLACSTQDITPILQCAATNCATMLTVACVEQNCALDFIELPTGCQQCLIGAASGGSLSAAAASCVH